MFRYPLLKFHPPISSTDEIAEAADSNMDVDIQEKSNVQVELSELRLQHECTQNFDSRS
jgi:hypothetical protein